jgi:hypothetical protein
MANQIVCLSTTYSASGDSSFTVSGVFWLVVPANNVVPTPKFQSQVPFIDAATLVQLRAGTLLEQSFTTGLFVTGTSLATIQSSVQSLFTTAQTVLTNSASPLAGLVGTEYSGSAWVTPPLGAVFDPAQNLISDMYWAAASGSIPGVTSGRATGYCSTNSSTVSKPVRGTVYTPQGTAAQRSLVSSSAADSASGIGAQQVSVTFLDTNFKLLTEVVTLNGTTPVTMGSANCAYVESMVVTRVGSAGQNCGAISILTGASSGTAWGSIAINQGTPLTGTVTTTTSSTSITFSVAQTLSAGQSLYFSGQGGIPYVLASAVSNSTSGTLTTAVTGVGGAGQTTVLANGDNQTMWAHHYVPAGVTCYILSFDISSFALLGTGLLLTTGNPSVANQPLIQVGPTLLHPGGGFREHSFTAALAVTGPNMIQLCTRPSTATNDTSMGNFEWIQF